VDDGGRLGLGTSTPVVDVHIKSGNTPTLRLEQDGSSGFTPQTWDVAGNEANFFVRDATNGSTLPFRIFPGAPSNALTIEATTGDVGIGTTSPAADLHITRSGAALIILENSTLGETWAINHTATGEFGLSSSVTGGLQATFSTTGDLTLTGDCTDSNGAGGTQGCDVADYVFEEDYEMLSLKELEAFITANKHLPNVPSAAEVAENGHSVRGMNYAVLAKVEELVLYTIQQQKTIEDLQARLKALESAKEK